MMDILVAFGLMIKSAVKCQKCTLCLVLINICEHINRQLKKNLPAKHRRVSMLHLADHTIVLTRVNYFHSMKGIKPSPSDIINKQTEEH